ncbi:aldo/keto reductase [Cryptosporangium arvum]|uniref:Putative oxidoreductase, aryl-alcohol dehydrogenase like protein n=1 Tax=Cryptosporangium arvum DSM 44712 TaxID=927661 RepID=A0A011AD11_9ACTN|nr:aldo/keto reductase [Cryptosporangium arvum]EXG79941.1 putative oxidoreductase, aryl-alcohol dehydrogenase like protein [Cryptosporangium arvum DSM 44712]
MKTRQLGADGPHVSAIGLGCLALSWTDDDDVARAVIHSALDHGITFFDTADVYGSGRNEELLGRALRGHRAEVTLASKAGLVDGGVDGSPDHIGTAIDASLYRLGSDVVDLYYLHRVDPAVPLAESWGALASLVEKGKVRHLGLSEVTPEQAAEAHAIHPVSAVQSEFSLWHRAPLETGVIEWCRANGAAFVPFAPLGRGSVNSLQPLRAVAERHRATPVQAAIAWVLAQGDHVIPVPGTTKRRYLQDNVAATRVALTADDLDDLALTGAGVAER